MNPEVENDYVSGNLEEPCTKALRHVTRINVCARQKIVPNAT